MDHSLKYKKNYKTLRRFHKDNRDDLGYGDAFAVTTKT